MAFRAACLPTRLAFIVVVAATALASAKDAVKAREIVARVVAVDLQSKSIRIENGTGPSQLVSVVGEAAESLDQLPIGRTFKLTYQDSTDGTRRDVIAIKRVKNSPKT